MVLGGGQGYVPAVLRAEVSTEHRAGRRSCTVTFEEAAIGECRNKRLGTEVNLCWRQGTRVRASEIDLLGREELIRSMLGEAVTRRIKEEGIQVSAAVRTAAGLYMVSQH